MRATKVEACFVRYAVRTFDVALGADLMETLLGLELAKADVQVGRVLCQHAHVLWCRHISISNWGLEPP